MGVIGTSISVPQTTVGQFGVLFAAEDNTAGTAYQTSDGSGYAHLGYAEVVAGTVNGTGNRGVMVAPSAQIYNFMPLDFLTQISIRRGRTNERQYDDVGTMTIGANNNTGDFDSSNTGGRYQRLTNPTTGTVVPATATYASWLQPGMAAKLQFGSTAGSAINVFTGVLETVVPTDDRFSTSTITFTDRLAAIGRASLIPRKQIGAAYQTTAKRIGSILDYINLGDIVVYNGSTTLIQTFRNIVGCTKTVMPQTVADNSLQDLQLLLDGEAGRMFCDRDGLLNFIDRAGLVTRAAGTAATFTDAPASVAGFGYNEIHTNQGQDSIYNAYSLKSAGVVTGSQDSWVEAVATDTDSVAQYGQRVNTLDVLLSDYSVALTVATFLATNRSNPKQSVESISFQAYGFSQSDLEKVFTLDLGQMVRVRRALPGNRTLDANHVIQGIDIDLTSRSYVFTLYLAPTDTATLA